MDSKRLTKKSKQLSKLLRHGARRAGLTMDTAGWTQLEAVLERLAMTRDELNFVVQHNNKSRLEVVGDRVRASQGHSLEGTPVTLDGLEASWRLWDRDELVWHGTTLAAARSILAGGGIHAASRTHVHLAAAIDSTVGKRASVRILLGVCPRRMRAAGHQLFVSPNGVVLAREVPAECLATVRAATRGGEAELPALAGLLRS